MLSFMGESNVFLFSPTSASLVGEMSSGGLWTPCIYHRTKRPRAATSTISASNAYIRLRTMTTSSEPWLATSTSTAADSGAAAAAGWHHRLQLLVDALFVQPLNQLRHRQLEDLADAEERGHGDRASGLHLLPMAGGEAKDSMSSCEKPRFLRSSFTRIPKARKNWS